jgi:hypothetical protein
MAGGPGRLRARPPGRGRQPAGTIIGSSIYHVGLQAGRWSQNQELQILTQAMYNARELATGTAVRHLADQGAHRAPDGLAFTSDLSAQDFFRLLAAGAVPVAFVLGTCVYHIAHQGVLQSLRQAGHPSPPSPSAWTLDRHGVTPCT